MLVIQYKGLELTLYKKKLELKASAWAYWVLPIDHTSLKYMRRIREMEEYKIAETQLVL